MPKSPGKRLSAKASEGFRKRLRRAVEAAGHDLRDLANPPPRRTQEWVYIAMREDSTPLSEAKAAELLLKAKAIGIDLPPALALELDARRPLDDFPLILVLPGEGKRAARYIVDSFAGVPGVTPHVRTILERRAAKKLEDLEQYCVVHPELVPDFKSEIAFRFKSMLRAAGDRFNPRDRAVRKQFYDLCTGTVEPFIDEAGRTTTRVVAPGPLSRLRQRYEQQFPKSPTHRKKARRK